MNATPTNGPADDHPDQSSSPHVKRPIVEPRQVDPDRQDWKSCLTLLVLLLLCLAAAVGSIALFGKE